ncbi:L-type lectin-domain containing protein [Rhodocytophaga aerolata]|uniref:L-type lectin-domain containing protein n=1 Tax=Rhodocytophaga aerolata TaxID=455078 RepID=A0ABT8R8N2_9BACT|nr:L-type lectin-domain containing protein [Rhodocytophaga aerolata]MDO1447102.1 L-type lectin-domain containing protein [Rhodocytophaga aerolata]
MARIFMLITFVINGFCVQAQFKLIGDADYMDNGCIRLTPDIPYSEGIAYSTATLNLEHNFEIEFDIFLGDKDEGADGITFVIHNDRRGFEAFGTWGECMGYGTWSRAYGGGTYIAPSVAVEFDTYENGRQNDPSSDHVAYLEDGSNFHSTYWNNNDIAFNLEDGYLHNFRFKWNPTTKKITVYLDGRIVYQGTKDLIKDIFKGSTEVIWGFTASTGRKSNLQYFCLKRLAMKKATPPAPKTTKPNLQAPQVTLTSKDRPQQAESQYARNETKK